MRPLALLFGAIALIVLTPARAPGAQPFYGPPARAVFDTGAESASRGLNPVEVLARAGDALPGAGRPGDAEHPSGISTAMSVMALLTVVSLAPSIMLMTTCYMRIIIVLALLRQAIGAASIPPPQVLTALALFMTLLVMSPTLERVWDEAVVPYQQGEVADYEDLWTRARQPLRDFMFRQLEATGNWSSLYMVLEYQGKDISEPASLTRADVSTTALVPAFMLSELKTAFVMGFKVYLPFLVIDMVIASLLISMSMMMLPPVLISLPFKLLLFVLVDGWTLVVGGLLYSFAPGAAEAGAVAMHSVHVLAPEAMRLALLR
jgi:flagellar biosynthetic protein FliP